MVNLAIFASGNGSNTENLISYFKNSNIANISLIACNNPNAFVIKRAENNKVPTLRFTREGFDHNDGVIKKLEEYNINFIVLAGFLWLIPQYLIAHFPSRIINLHPALLPKFGGKGMYGMHVHRAVIENGELESGISIHFVNEFYDEGGLIAQHKCSVDKHDSPESLAAKVSQLEHQFFPLEIEKLAYEMNR